MIRVGGVETLRRYTPIHGRATAAVDFVPSSVDLADIPPFPALVSAVHRFVDPSGDLWVGHARNWIRLRSIGDGLERLLDLLNGSLSVAELIARVSAWQPPITDRQVIMLLNSFAAHGFLMTGSLINTNDANPSLSERYIERHSRDLEFYALFEKAGKSRFGHLARIHDAKVVVIGMGGLGSWICLALACLGVGSIVGIDPDFVEPSNLARQPIYLSDDVGQLKVEAARAFFQRFSPEMEFIAVSKLVTASEELVPTIRDSNLIVLAADWPPRTIGRLTNTAAVEAGVPALYAFGGLDSVVVGPLVVPGVTPCYECLASMRSGESHLAELFVRASREQWEMAPTPAIVAVPSILGNMLAWESLCWLTGVQEPQSLGCLLQLDLITMTATPYPVVRNLECPVCSGRRDMAHRERVADARIDERRRREVKNEKAAKERM